MNEYLCFASDGTSTLWFYVTAATAAAALTAGENHISSIGGLGVLADGSIPTVTVRVLTTTQVSGTVSVVQQQLP